MERGMTEHLSTWREIGNFHNCLPTHLPKATFRYEATGVATAVGATICSHCYDHFRAVLANRFCLRIFTAHYHVRAVDTLEPSYEDAYERT
jgi:hypothetical protein